VLVSSEYTGEEDRRLALLVGASDLVRRSPGLEEAIAAIETACRTDAPAAGPPTAVLEQEYLASLRRQIDRQLAHSQELSRRAGIQAAALSMVGALAQALAKPREVSAVMGDVLVHCLDAAGLSVGLLYVRDADGALRVHCMAGVPDVLRAEAEAGFGRMELLEGPDGTRPTALNDASIDAAEREFLARLKRRSALVVPFRVAGAHYGTLVLASDLHDLTEEAWTTFAGALAAQFGQAVALGRSLGQLAESDELLRNAVEASPNGMVMADARGRVVMVNRQTERMFGYAPGELAGQPLENLLPARHRTAHVGHRATFLASPHARPMGAGRELFGLKKNGQEFPVEIGLAPVTRGGDHFVIASVVDITERRRAEERIRWLSLAVDQGPTAVVMTDITGKIEYVNPTFTEVTGYTLDDVRGKNPRILKGGVTPPDTYKDLWRTITAGRPWHGELLNRKKNGSAYWDATWVYPIRDAGGVVTRFLAIKEDVTERKKAEAAAAEAAARVTALMEHANDGISVISPKGVILEVNRRMAEIAGLTQQELVGRNIAEFPTPDTVAAKLAEFQNVLRRGAGTVPNVAITRSDGQIVTIDFSLSSVEVAGETLVLAIGRDVTQSRQTEAQLRQAQKMEAIGRLAGGVAHDFNNVLTAIFGYVEVVMEELPPESTSRADLDEVLKAAARAAGLTRQLLAFSRQQVLQPTVLNVNDVVDNVEKMLRRVIGEDINLRTTLAADVGNALADAGQLEQVLMNLAVNARDAMPDGGHLTIETANVDLTEEYADLHQPVVPGAYIRMAVSDTGTGMSAETRARVFEPFFTTKEKGKGTGLGLSTVYGIVKQSGGYVWVYSEPGRGTTFKIYLPRVDTAATVIAAGSPKPEARHGTETILVAEDDEVLRPMVRTILRRQGYTVLDAPNVGDAVACAAAHQGPIHLLLSDVVMPGGSGRDLARRLAETRPDTKVLYVSGYTDDAIVHHGMLEPGLEYLQKPFTGDTLSKKVRQVLDAV